MQYTTVLSFALLLYSLFVIAQGCTCTLSGHFYMRSNNCTGTMMCRNFTFSGGECIVQDGSSAWVDCLSQTIITYNSSDCSGIQAIGVVPDQCYALGVYPAATYTWNEDCEGNAVPVENSEECDPVPEPAEDEVCFCNRPATPEQLQCNVLFAEPLEAQACTPNGVRRAMEKQEKKAGRRKMGNPVKMGDPRARAMEVLLLLFVSTFFCKPFCAYTPLETPSGGPNTLGAELVPST
ncbi:hypothetical protein QOT17_022795 [Balamuthia mandrillaris]